MVGSKFGLSPFFTPLMMAIAFATHLIGSKVPLVIGSKVPLGRLKIFGETITIQLSKSVEHDLETRCGPNSLALSERRPVRACKSTLCDSNIQFASNNRARRFGFERPEGTNLPGIGRTQGKIIRNAMESQ